MPAIAMERGGKTATAGCADDELVKYLSGGLFAMRVDVPGFEKPLFDLDVQAEAIPGS